MNDQTTRNSWYLFLSALICSVGSPLQFGYNLASINIPAIHIKKFFHYIKSFNSVIWPIAVSIFAVGTIIGCYVGPNMAKRMGRKKTLLINNVFAITGGILLFASKFTYSIVMFITGRVMVGVNAGINIVVSPMYLSEIAPVHLRGAFGSLTPLAINAGILIGNVLGTDSVLGEMLTWNYLLGFTIIIAIIQLMLFNFCPESPRWMLAEKSDEQSTRAILQRLRNKSNVDEEVDEIKRDVANESQIERVNVIELFRHPHYRKPLLIGIMVQVAHQAAGNTVLLNYSTDMFINVGLSPRHSQYITCGIGSICTLMTLLSVFLIEKVGRRNLLLASQAGTGFMYVVATISFVYIQKNAEWAKYLGVIAILCSVAIYQGGLSPIPYFIVAELFTQPSVATAMSITGPINRLTNLIVVFSFPPLDHLLYPYTFLVYTGFLIFLFTGTYFYVPETKGRTVADISNGMKKNRVEQEP